MTDTDIRMIEDYLIMKGLEAVSKNPDKTELRRQINIKEYKVLSKQGKTRVSYWADMGQYFR